MTSPRRGPRRRLPVALFVVLVGLASGVVAWQVWPDECGDSFPGIQLNDEVNSECIGVTDGSYQFNDPNEAANAEDRKIVDRINDIQARIAQENREVAGTNRYVKVVLLMPLTVSRARPPAISLSQILYSLEGSYTALYRANHSADFGDASAVRIQLLLANQGSLQQADADFLDGVLKESESEHPVVSVVGLGSSIPNTVKAVDHLAQRGIPMVSAVASADILTDKPLLWSVSPSNKEYAGRLKSFLDDQDSLRSGVIVYDRNTDLYTQSLKDAYHEQLGPYIKFSTDQSFQGSTLLQPAAPNVFSPVVTNLCVAANDPRTPLDMVFYAGRIADLGPFAQALKSRICKNLPLTILFGDTGFTPTPDIQTTLRTSNVKVIVAASSNSPGWGRKEPGTPPGYAPFLDAYHNRGFADGDLSDGYAIAHHDALVSATRAIRLAALGKPTQAPNPSDVATQFGQLNLAYIVPAAAGTLSFPQEGGRATGQLITIQQLE